MVLNREEGAQKAESVTSYPFGMCQMFTRECFEAPSAGDQDRDGDADAVDGWKSEPVRFRHPGDRNPPRGVPVAWAGGSSGHGHRAVSLGKGKIRSTDAGGSGVVATVDLSWVEENWGMTYLGWSESISGTEIPLPPPPTRGKRIDHALRDLRHANAKKGTPRRRWINRALDMLLKIRKH